MADILVLESSQKSLEKLKFFLEKDRHRVKIPQEAESLEKILSEKKFDVIVVDAHYAGCPPADLIEIINKDRLNSYTQTIVTTTFAKNETLNQLISAGVSFLFIKPYRYRLLAQKIQKITQPQEGSQGAFEPLMLKIFLESIQYVLDAVVGTQLITASRPFLKNGRQSLADVSAVMDISSDEISGSIALSFSHDILQKFLFKLFEHEVEYDNKVARDTCLKICHQTITRAKHQFLKKKNIKLESRLPTILSESLHVLDYKMSTPVLVVPFLYEKNPGIFIEFCLRTN